MAKFNAGATKTAVVSPITSERTASARTHEGGAGFVRDARSELFLLAVANMVGERTFYESGGARDERYADLVHEVTTTDPEWVVRFLRWLRTEANMRSASLVGAAEFTWARLVTGESGLSRQVVDSVLQRADEPGELLAYWTSVHGRAIPKPVKRGVADAVRRLYTERALAKWDSAARGFRFGDVLDLTHPSATDTRQGDLYRHALNVRHRRDEPVPSSLGLLTARAELLALPVAERRALFSRPTAAAELRRAGLTWESVAGWLHGPLTAAVWEALIPSMGYMALLRNVRNFDEAGVSDEVAAGVAATLADPEEVARSRQFPFRFLAAYRAAPSLRWGQALERALAASLATVPALGGRTLICVDRSPSMFPGYHFSTKVTSDISCADQAAVFGLALALRAEQATTVVYGGTSRVVKVAKGGSLLKAVNGLGPAIDYTDTAGAVRAHFAGHDRVVVITDEQSATADAAAGVPADVPVYVWNLAGYRHGNTPAGGANRHTFGGLSDAAFRMVPLLEAGRSADWPF
ncbi:TROVE domain-containing protein [Umezawaea sp. NPDC059074]|uniref:TROVE domain-containing protein n=1 Tax=Umezawaea sp. NPDC059074 TaxID=3346716 RepID=UPI00367A32A8